MAENSNRGSISFFATYRPPVALDVFSLPYPSSSDDVQELCMTDGVAYNCNGQAIPRAGLNNMLLHPILASKSGAKPEDVVSGLTFVSERTEGLETLHIALRFSDDTVKVFNFAEVYGTFNGARLEDHGCVAGEDSDYLVYVSTKEDPHEFHQPWNAVYRTHLVTGETQRLTPQGQIDFSPSVSPDGRMIAVASYQGKDGGWCGEVEDLETNIVVFELENPSTRKLVVKNGGWPSWGSNDTLFFHRNTEKDKLPKRWGVFRVSIHDDESKLPIRVTPETINAITPAGINATTVAVTTIREQSKLGETRHKAQHRHIEIFEVFANSSQPQEAIENITQAIGPKVDHFNSFVMVGANGKTRIGYHRCNDVRDGVDQYAVVDNHFVTIKSPNPNIGVFRVSGVFPTFSPDGRKLAFVDNKFQNVYVADENGLREVYPADVNGLFAPTWNQNPDKDVLYVCKGPTFSPNEDVHIIAIPVAASGNQRCMTLTKPGSNNAFPSTNPEGTKLVFRSTRDGVKNLYIMEDTKIGEYSEGEITRITEGNWTDTHCQWSPKGDWIVFSSNRENPTAPKKPDLPDAGFFGLYLVNSNSPHTVVKIIDSGYDFSGSLFAGHVNHPYFSPDGRSIVVVSDLAGVSCEPISLPLFSHSVRPYGDIFIIDLVDMEDMTKNEDLKEFRRVTHSRYENSTAVWTKYSTQNADARWNMFLANGDAPPLRIDPSLPVFALH